MDTFVPQDAAHQDAAKQRPRRVLRHAAGQLYFSGPGIPLLIVAAYVVALGAFGVVIWKRHQAQPVAPPAATLAGQFLPDDTADSPTLIVAANCNRQVILLVLPHGDATRTSMLLGPRLWGRAAARDTLALAALSLQSLTGDTNQQQQALLLTIDGETMIYVADATKPGTLRAATPSERARLAPLIE